MRSVLAGFAAAVVAPAPPIALAGDYAEKPMGFIVPYAA
jgi:tripartite-type tricarboxylate transporter receptor subunit TctC